MNDKEMQLFILQILCGKERSFKVVSLRMSAFLFFEANNSRGDKTYDFHGDQPGV